jgi:hypothetical protein
LGGTGIENAFVATLNPAGSALVYSTYLGGSSTDQGAGIAVDSSGNAYVTGYAYSSNFPVTSGAFQTSLGGTGIENAFVAKLNATGSTLVYSTYLGGSFHDLGAGIAVDSSGNAYVTGSTYSDNFPTTSGAFQTSLGGLDAENAFLAKLNPTGSALVYSTYLGGSGSDGGRGIAVDSSGNGYVTGYAESTNFPTTTGAFQTSLGGTGAENAFMAKLNATGSALVYSTYLGGSSTDQGAGIAVDSSGNGYVTGYAESTNFPTTTGAFQTSLGGVANAFVAKFSALTGPGVAFTASSLEFESQAVGTTSAAEAVTLTNSGSDPLTVTTVTISGSNTSDFSESDNCVSSSPIAPAGTCTLDLTFTPTAVGSRTATLVVTDNSDYVNGSQQTVDLTGTGFQATTTTAVASSANPSVFGQSVTFTATVTPQGLGTPTGTVTFNDGTAAICNAVALSSGQATCTPASLAVGTHSITAVYSGDSNFKTSTSSSLTQTVNTPAPALTSISPSTATAGGVAFTLTVNGTGFVSSAVVQWNGAPLSTTFVSATQLTAQVAASLIANAGTAAVTVVENGLTSNSASLTITAGVASGVSLTGLSPTSVPTQPTGVGVALSSPATAQLTGTLTLSFTPNPKVTNVPSGYSDPAMQFANGGTTMNFTIPAGATTATLPQNGAIQLGTVAGTITVTLTQLSANGTSVLPQPPPSLSVSLPLLAPVIASGSIEIINITSTGLEVELDGYSTSRDLASATFNFQAASGTQLTGSTSFSVPLTSIAPGWFSGTSGLQNGGSFELIVPFTFSGDTSVFGPNSVAVTLSNSVGSSSP